MFYHMDSPSSIQSDDSHETDILWEHGHDHLDSSSSSLSISTSKTTTPSPPAVLQSAVYMIS